MSEDLPDLETIDPTTPHEPLPATSAWAPGWYADPWTAGQYRYWSGQTWTGETNRWGPSTSDAAPAAGNTGAATNPWPSLSAPAASGYGWPAAPAPEVAPADDAPRRGRGRVIVGVALALVVVLVSGAIGFAIESNSHSNPQSQANPLPLIPGGTTSPTPSTVPGAGVSHDPNRRALSRIVVQQSDVDTSRVVLLIPNGNLLTEPTLDLCNGAYPSERLRTARLQVADVDASTTSHMSLSTEAVLYRNAAASEQAFAELRRVSASCPHAPVVSPVGEGTAQTVFKKPPDASWPQVPTVTRQAYSFVSTTAATATQPASTTPQVAVYLRRGRALLGMYFAQPNGAQSPVAGQRTIEGIVGVFAARLAKLPAAVVKGP